MTPHYYAMPGLKFRHAINKYDNIPYILETVAKYFCISVEQMKQKNRSQPLVTARQIAMYLIQRNTDMPLKKIGLIFGGYDHTTVIHACRLIDTQFTARFDNQIKTDLSIILNKL